MDLEGCSATEFPGIQDKGGGDGAVAFEGFCEERGCQWGAPRVDPCVSPGRVSEGCNEIGGPGPFP